MINLKTSDFVPLAELRANIASYLKTTSKRPVIISKNGRAAGAVISPALLDDFLEFYNTRENTLASLGKNISVDNQIAQTNNEKLQIKDEEGKKTEFEMNVENNQNTPNINIKNNFEELEAFTPQENPAVENLASAFEVVELNAENFGKEAENSLQENIKKVDLVNQDYQVVEIEKPAENNKFILISKGGIEEKPENFQKQNSVINHTSTNKRVQL